MHILTYLRDLDLFPIPEAILNVGGFKLDANVVVGVNFDISSRFY